VLGRMVVGRVQILRLRRVMGRLFGCLAAVARCLGGLRLDPK
jgi:hypothetical protein